MLIYKQIVFRLFISLVLSTLIGLNRESTNKPAGLRTHVLVCVSSTLVMLLSLFIFDNYKGETSLQPDRISAQVISGIGFLGAGTILREGNTVKGLTTAASLWAVACIGLAIGAGFYFGGILTTVLVLITLIAYSRVGRKIKHRGKLFSVNVISLNKPGQLGEICKIIGDYGIIINSIDMDSEDDELVEINIDMFVNNDEVKYEILNRIARTENVLEISQKN